MQDRPSGHCNLQVDAGLHSSLMTVRMPDIHPTPARRLSWVLYALARQSVCSLPACPPRPRGQTRRRRAVSQGGNGFTRQVIYLPKQDQEENFQVESLPARPWKSTAIANVWVVFWTRKILKVGATRSTGWKKSSGR
jgi:hypothetical protein